MQKYGKRLQCDVMD